MAATFRLIFATFLRQLHLNGARASTVIVRSAAAMCIASRIAAAVRSHVSVELPSAYAFNRRPRRSPTLSEYRRAYPTQ
jgi:hypothetical protein